MNLKEVKELIELVSEKGFTEFEIERQGLRMRLARYNQQPATPQASIAPPVIAVPIPPAAPVLPSTQSAQEAAEAAKGTTASPARLATEEAVPDSSLHIIKSPLVGTFYRAPSPTVDPFVKVGDRIEPETIVCIIEAMKLMNNIQAEVSGEVARIYVENGHPVEYGQPLFGIKT